jgi:phosphoglycolate phosphatase
MATILRPCAMIFDWDNTLVDSWPTIHAANNAALMAMGHEAWSIDETKSRVRKAMREAYPELFGDRWQEARDIFYAHFRETHLRELAAIDGRRDMLGAIAAAGIYMGIVSNKDGALLRAEVEHLGWGSFFGAVIGAGDAPRDKPAPDPRHLSLEPTIYSSDRLVWYVGDTDIDMECAAAAGVVPVLLRAKPPEAGEFGGCAPELIFANGENLCAFLDAAGN